MADAIDKSAELRAMLDERGVEYETNDIMGARETSWRGFTAFQLTPNANLVMAVTPEQAIAATLGSDRDAIYDAGFTSGVKATLQQLDGLLMKTDSAVEIQAWVDEQWEES